MTELSNAATVLIARMETHPEDFEYGNKFGDFAEAMWGLVGADDGIKAPLWFLSDADKQALRGAWAKLHYGRWEKDIMEKVFDEGYYERLEKERIYEQQMKQQMYQQRMAMQNQLAASTGTYQTATIAPGQIHPLQNSNSGLLGSIFGGSK